MRSARRRHGAVIRIVALFLLLWVGFDVGAHGLLASDFSSPGDSTSWTRLTTSESGATTQFTHDHCFCHSLSVGAMLPAPGATLTPAGVVVLPISSHAPGRDASPLDHPPQLRA